jgi:LPXTG-site transpeptidase (sortase) family protein
VVTVMVAAVAMAAVAFTAASCVDRSAAERAAGPAPEAGSLGAPARVAIPAIGVDAPIVPVGLDAGGAMQTPGFGSAGWYEPGPKPGEAGPAVVVAHVDSKANGPDVFFRLRELRPGDQVTVHYPSQARTFRVTATEQAAKTALPTGKIWTGTADPVLRLITCGGAFDRRAGSYLDNVIVYADDLEPARS